MLVTLDWESAYGTSPTGRKVTLKGAYGMSTEEYVRDGEFKVHGLGVKINDQPARYYYGQALPQVLRLIPWREAAVLAHHTHFDGAILAWRCGIRPKFWLDTISMAKAIYNQHPAALAYLAPFLGFGEKGDELAQFKDKWTLTDEEQKNMGIYCCNDIELTYQIFQKLREGFPLAALRSIDVIIRMFTEPQFEVNTDSLVPAYKEELTRKRGLIKDLGVTKKQLRSNQQFADLLKAAGAEVPMKISPTTHKPTFAFAKSDEKFIQLKDHPDPAVSALVTARLGVKTSIVETRLKRFYGIGKRGMMPVYLKPNSAHTKRVGGGDKSNLTNMSNRGFGLVLRNSLVAPEGKKIVVWDLSQIEARFLVWWAGQVNMVENFRQGKDPYNAMASQLYGREINRKNVPADKAPGAVGKATILGCFGPNTHVVTNRGLVKIIDINDSDMLWDGGEFVNHQGVLDKGVRECQTKHGLSATKEHEILTEHGWRGWQEVHTNPSLFQSATSKANSLYLDGANDGLVGQEKSEATIRTYGAVVDGKASSLDRTSKKGTPPDAIFALSRRVATQTRNTTDMRIFFPTTTTESGYSTESAPVWGDATTRRTASTRVMEGGVFSSMDLGGRTAKLFSSTLLLLKTGIYHILNLIVPTTTEGMNQGISDSSAGEKISKTNELSEECSERLQTYDIAYSGPRNRYCVMTDCGPIIVHNCGYGLGWFNFQGQLRVGFLGMPGIVYGQDYVDQLGVSIPAFKISRSYDPKYSNLEEQALSGLPNGMDEETHITHCAVVWTIVNKYRSLNPKVKALWKRMNEHIGDMILGRELQVGPFRTGKDCIHLPSGLTMRYPELKQSTSGDYSYVKEYTKTGNKIWTKLYGGKLVENLVQAACQIFIADSGVEMQEAGYPVALTVYDEIVCVVDEDKAQDCSRLLELSMTTAPAWCHDLPLGADGDIVNRYGDAK